MASSDKEDNPAKWTIPDGVMIQGNSYLLFNCTGRDLQTQGGELHTNFKLTQTKADEVLVLSMPNNSIVDLLPLGLTLVEHSHSRETDGSDTWKFPPLLRVAIAIIVHQ